MNIANPVPSTVNSISFSFLTSEDVRRISVKTIINPVLLDDLNRPNIGGLYDPALGPSDKFDLCSTCHLSSFACPGHYGHIELPSPVFHPLFMAPMFNLLRGVCMFCHKFKLGRSVICKYNAKLRLIEHGLLVAAKALDDIIADDRKGDEDEAGVSAEEFEARIRNFVKASIARAPSSKRDHYKDTLVYQARKEVITEFMRAIVARKQCLNCISHGYTFRKEGHTKIIEYDLSHKHKKQHQAMDLVRPEVLPRASSTRHNVDAPDQDSDSDSEAEPAGESAFSDHDMDVDEDANAGQQMPKSASGKTKTSRGRNERVMPPEECRQHLRRLFDNERHMCALIFGRHGPFAHVDKKGYSTAKADMFFMEVVLVPPTRFRPAAKMGEMLFEHQQNELLGKILQTSYRLRDINDEIDAASLKSSDVTPDGRLRLITTFLDTLITLQNDVNSFIDSSKNPAPVRQGKLPPSGVKQLLEKKEGLFRKNMMGKRVNYAARSVISPDVNIEPNEIGVPPVFARKLTFPEPVTPHNVHLLRELVIAGAKSYPGASMVEYEDGSFQSLANISLEQRTAIANQLLTPQQGKARHGLDSRSTSINKKVYRHLRDGDVLILNRQPTLHKPSMMVHRARVLLGEKTIRMHYANCNSYNADFDGDEMNIHFPQNQVARAEAMMIANTDNQYLVPTSGKPLRGLIQDHVVAGLWMTNRDSFFTREEYFQLLYGALRPEETTGRLITLPPAIWRPKPLWTGKQIISTVMKNITPDRFVGMNTLSGTKVPGGLWGKDSYEDQVMFMDGELMSGVLDKAAFGASDYGMVHSVYELYGADIAGKLLGVLSRLFTKYLQHRAFTCRMDDLVLTPAGDAERTDIIQKGANLGTEGTIDNFPTLAGMSPEDRPEALKALLQEVLRDDAKMAGLDVTVKTRLTKLTESIANATMPHNLLRKFPHNHMQAMTQSGAKGSAVNARQISCALGQQELEGRRVPVMISGKTLPSFKPFETKAIAGGYVASRFLTGVKPQEFYFHCMAGREGLIDTAVKTSRSGYLQRCLIKHLEGLRVHYDNTVRGSDQSVYQFYYGGDALDVTRQKHLYQFEFAARNERSLLVGFNPKELGGKVEDTEAVAYMKKVLKRSAVRPSKDVPAKREKLDTAMSRYSPQGYLGATSEKFAEKVQDYIARNPENLLKVKGGEALRKNQRFDLIPYSRFQLLMNIKYMKSLIDPGEAVGLLASQGVGEPSTQMTLNTFHFAGHGAANVTLGIPRLREIVMTASAKPKTPSMTIPIRKGVSAADIERFCKHATRLNLSQLVDTVSVQEQLTASGDSRRREYAVTVTFFPAAEYRAEHDVRPVEILAALPTYFAAALGKEIETEMKKLGDDVKAQMKQVGKGRSARAGAGRAADDGDGDGDEGEAPTRREEEQQGDHGDGDAEDEKRARQSKQQATYDSDEESMDENQMIEDAYGNGAASGDDDDDEDEAAPAVPKAIPEDEIGHVRELFKANCRYLTEFEFDEERCTFKLELEADQPKLLLVGIIERACSKTIVREIPGIKDCFAGKDEGKGVSLTTNGSNFRGLWRFAAGFAEEIMEEEAIYSNDIYAILGTYGVEAARLTILREIAGVFGVYKIDVDARHLELIGDYMTFDGGYKPFNRKGISTHSSPLLKASYETTASFISDAALHGDFDDLTSPSGSIVVGRPNSTGTGAFDVMAAV